MSRLCYECIHMRVSEAELDWSEITPGSDFHMWCNKTCWRWDIYATNKRKLRDIIVSAEDCSDYEPDPEMVGGK